MDKNYSQDIAHVIKDYFKQEEKQFSFDEDAGVFRLIVGLDGQIKSIGYIIDIEDDGYCVYAISPVGADSNDSIMMANLAEFICRANYGLKNGNFELDFSDGEVRYKVFVDCDGIIPTKEIIQSSVYCPAGMFEHYASGIVGIIFNGLNAKEAIDKCEKANLEVIREYINDHPEMTELVAKFGLDEQN